MRKNIIRTGFRRYVYRSLVTKGQTCTHILDPLRGHEEYLSFLRENCIDHALIDSTWQRVQEEEHKQHDQHGEEEPDDPVLESLPHDKLEGLPWRHDPKERGLWSSVEVQRVVCVIYQQMVHATNLTSHARCTSMQTHDANRRVRKEKNIS